MPTTQLLEIHARGAVRRGNDLLHSDHSEYWYTKCKIELRSNLLFLIMKPIHVLTALNAEFPPIPAPTQTSNSAKYRQGHQDHEDHCLDRY